MDLSLRILSLTLLTAAFCSNVISGQLYLQPPDPEQGYFTNDGFFITCYTAGAPSGELQWLGTNEEAITDTEGRIHVAAASGLQQGLELVVEKVEMDDAGNYVCTDVDHSTSFTLHVYRSISFSDTPKVQSAVEGEDAIIKCHVKSEPKPVVNWHRNDSKLKDGSKYTIEEGSHELIIHNISRSDGGIYICSAYAIAHLRSQSSDFEIMVQVEYSPELVGEKTDEAYAGLDSLANISCLASGQPTPKFYWFRDEIEIHNSSDYMIFHSENESILQMRMENQSQFGTYTCQAVNKLGEKQKTIDLKRGATPVAPIVSVSKENQGEVHLSIKMPDSYDGDLEVFGYRVKYALKSDPSNTTKFQDFTIDEKNHVLKNMSYNSEYIIQVAARNAAGHGDYSEITHKTSAFEKADKVSGSTSIKGTLTLLLVTFLICM